MYTVSSNEVYAFRSAPKSDAALLQKVDELLLRESLGPVESHVLDEVRETSLVVVFEHGAGIHTQPDLRALFRLLVRENVIGQPVVELALGEASIQGQGPVELVERLGRCASRGYRGGALRRRRRTTSRRETEDEEEREGSTVHGRGTYRQTRELTSRTERWASFVEPASVWAC